MPFAINHAAGCSAPPMVSWASERAAKVAAEARIPDEDRGEAISRFDGGYIGAWVYVRTGSSMVGNVEHGLWFGSAFAEALLEVAEVERFGRLVGWGLEYEARARAALDKLEAARGT